MERTVSLRDGTRLDVRSITPDDKAALVDGLERMGPVSRYRRFLAPIGRLRASDLRYLTEVDHHDHEALVARPHGDSQGVGVARYVRLPDDRGAAEFAVAVADDWQGRGVGTALLALLADRAREEGVERFRGLMLPRTSRCASCSASWASRASSGATARRSRWRSTSPPERARATGSTACSKQRRGATPDWNRAISRPAARGPTDSANCG